MCSSDLSVSIKNTAKPRNSAFSSTTLFYGGKGIAALSIGSGNTTAGVQIDGTIESEGIVASAPESVGLAISTLWEYIQTDTGQGVTITTAEGSNVLAPVSLDNGAIIRDPVGDLYRFDGNSGSLLDLGSVVLASDPNFTAVGTSTFTDTNSTYGVGDRVQVRNAAAGYDFVITSSADGDQLLAAGSNQVVAASGSDTPFTVQTDQIILASDGFHYRYIETVPLTTTLDALTLSNPSWELAAALEPDSPLVVTAVLPRDATAQDFVLAAGQPSDLSKGQATGNQHRIYRVVQQLFDGSDPLLVDVERNELVLGNAEGETIIDYAPGQSVQYSVLPDQESAKDSYPIEGLTGGTDYYLIPRGGTRYALAASQEDALAGQIGRAHV